MNVRRFDALLIDFYGTIAAGDREAVDAACARVVQTCEIPVTVGEFARIWGEAYFATVARSNHDAFRTLYECELASLRESLDKFDRQVDPSPFLVELEEYWRDPPVHSDALELFRRLDLPVCCVSNADIAPLKSAIARHRLRFDHIVSSEEVRSYKPDRRIFEEALSKMRVKPHRCLHVGDSMHSDIAGASALGITTVWIHRADRVMDIGNHPPDHTITSLEELLPLLA